MRISKGTLAAALIRMHPKRQAVLRPYAYVGKVYNDKRKNGRTIRVVGLSYTDHHSIMLWLRNGGFNCNLTRVNGRIRIMVYDN